MAADGCEEVVRVIVAANSRLFADVLAGALRQWGIEVVHSGPMSGAEAVETFQRACPDVALLDHVLSGCGGLEATGVIRASSPGAKVILLAGIFTPDQVERALSSGAVGFLPKSLGLAELVEAIRQAHRGRPLVYAEELANLVDELNACVQHSEELHDRYATLTGRELELLAQLGDGKMTAEVAANLNVSPGTLKNHLTRIYTKTGAACRLEAIDNARRIGIIPPRRGSESRRAP